MLCRVVSHRRSNSTGTTWHNTQEKVHQNSRDMSDLSSTFWAQHAFLKSERWSLVFILPLPAVTHTGGHCKIPPFSSWVAILTERAFFHSSTVIFIYYLRALEQGNVMPRIFKYKISMVDSTDHRSTRRRCTRKALWLERRMSERMCPTEATCTCHPVYRIHIHRVSKNVTHWLQ